MSIQQQQWMISSSKNVQEPQPLTWEGHVPRIMMTVTSPVNPETGFPEESADFIIPSITGSSYSRFLIVGVGLRSYLVHNLINLKLFLDEDRTEEVEPFFVQTSTEGAMDLGFYVYQFPYWSNTAYFKVEGTTSDRPTGFQTDYSLGIWTVYGTRSGTNIQVGSYVFNPWESQPSTTSITRTTGTMGTQTLNNYVIYVVRGASTPSTSASSINVRQASSGVFFADRFVPSITSNVSITVRYPSSVNNRAGSMAIRYPVYA